MRRLRKRAKLLLMAILLAFSVLLGPQRQVAMAASYEARDGFNDEYVFATTRGLNNMEGVHPAAKLTLMPVTIVLDTAFLPFAVIAGFVS